MLLEGPFFGLEPVGQYGRHIIRRQRRDGHKALWIFEKCLKMVQIEKKKTLYTLLSNSMQAKCSG